MPAEKWSPGPTSDRVAENLAGLRKQSRLTLDELAGYLEELGRRMPPDSIRNAEPGAARRRRVDVDDLVALARALDVTPNRLLLPATTDPERRIALVAESDLVTELEAWEWAQGRAPLDPPAWAARADQSQPRARSFRARNVPLDPSVDLDALGPYFNEVHDVVNHVSDVAGQCDLPRLELIEMAKDVIRSLERGQASDGS